MRRRTRQLIPVIALAAGAWCLAGCSGKIGDPGGASGAGPAGGGGAGGAGGGAGGAGGVGGAADLGSLTAASTVRRLTRVETNNVLRDLLKDDSKPAASLLPEDATTPFDNDYTQQSTSKALVEGVERIAGDAATRLLADPVRRDEVVGCTPSGTADASCIGSFIADFGRRALRRPLTDAEKKTLSDGALAAARDAGDFYAGVETVIRVLLQHPRFVYRIEIGAAVDGKPGLFKLDGYEVASRLSFLIWGSTPSSWLLDAAGRGDLDSPAGVRAAAEKMLDDPRARARVGRFHAMWLGYESLPHPAALADAMRRETQALIERVIFEDKLPWQELFRFQKTFVNDTLAAHYGLPKPGSTTPVWVDYGSSGRAGILSHGTFLSNGAKATDTSPTLRGLAVRERLFCQHIPPPPPTVNADDPPPKTAANPCKKDRYAQHSSGGCANCHSQMDPVGFGLENYDQLGRYRTHDPGEPSCTIDGKGELVNIGAFTGPAELGKLAVSSGLVSKCLVERLHQLAIGRSKLDDNDRRFIHALHQQVGKDNKDFRFDELLLAMVSSPAFLHRRVDSSN